MPFPSDNPVCQGTDVHRKHQVCCRLTVNLSGLFTHDLSGQVLLWFALFFWPKYDGRPWGERGASQFWRASQFHEKRREHMPLRMRWKTPG
jgi:hypothetical protein